MSRPAGHSPSGQVPSPPCWAGGTRAGGLVCRGRGIPTRTWHFLEREGTTTGEGTLLTAVALGSEEPRGKGDGSRRIVDSGHGSGLRRYIRSQKVPVPSHDAHLGLSAFSFSRGRCQCPRGTNASWTISLAVLCFGLNLMALSVHDAAPVLRRTTYCRGLAGVGAPAAHRRQFVTPGSNLSTLSAEPLA